MERDIKKIISQMTLEEKASLCSGLDFWNTKPVERLGIPSIMMTDGPHGLRKQAESADHLGFNRSVPATCFPPATTLACSWDRKLLQKVGTALGEECQAEDVAIILGPAVNIKRSPLCGRNFEYFSEDPFLASEMAANHIKGVQSQGVGTSLKHYAANNQEHKRMSIDTIIDERTLREIYLASFETAVKKSQPWTVMCAYNKVNGEYCSENKYLLTNILKEEWGHEGFVVSDWGAVNERVDGLAAGLELEMPFSYGTGEKKIIYAVKTGELSESVLDQAVERLLTVIFKAVDNKKQNASYDRDTNHKIAREAARESMVLLKNEGGILPLKKDSSLAVIGALARKPRYQGGGSSHINPSKLENILEEIQKASANLSQVTYSEGYSLDSDEFDEEMVSTAQKLAAESDITLIFAGLPDRYESEGYDREHMRIPENQTRLIEAVAKVQSNIVVVLSNGSPIEMPWIDLAKGVLEVYLGGQAVAGATADVLFGYANPCGKLAETFPKELSHNPSYLNFSGEGDRVEYREGIFVGYRYYDTKMIEPRFPFGYGMSYTTFEYTGISVDKKQISDREILNVIVKVKNTGKMYGKEIVQLYIKDVESTMLRPEKELKGFGKIGFQPGEEKTVEFALDKRSFAYYNVQIKDWHVESGIFEILVGASSKDIRLKETVEVNSSVPLKKKYHRNTTVGELIHDPYADEIVKEIMEYMSGEGGLISGLKDNPGMMAAFLKYMPLRALVNFGQGKYTEDIMNEMIRQLNNKY